MKRHVFAAIAALSVLSASATNRLLNVDYGIASAPREVGPAAIGLATNDFWNLYDRDAHAVINGASGALKWSDGTSSAATLTVDSTAWGAWGAGDTDSMMHTYLYGSTDVSIGSHFSGFPAGTYDMYFYAHGFPAGENGVVELIVGGVSKGTLSTTTTDPWNTAGWTEGREFVVFRDVTIGNDGSFDLISKPGSTGLSVLNGAQFLFKDGGDYTPPPAPPSITQQPLGGNAFAGDTVGLNVGAQGDGLSFQWQFNGTDLTGETNATLTIANFASANVGSYSVVVSGTGGAQVVSSAAKWSLSEKVSAATLNVDYTAHLNPAFSVKSGPAAIGVSSNDFWNVYSRDTTSMFTWRSGGVVTNLKLSDGSSSGATLTVTNAAGAWFTFAGDPMLVSYLYPLGKGGSIVSKLTNLPTARYDVYVYAHGQPAGENSVIRLKLNGVPLDAKSTSDQEGWDSAGWADGKQFVVFHGIEVATGTELQVVSSAGVNGMATINGLQLEPRSTSGLRIVTQPVSVTVTNGSVADFSVEAEGSGDLSYQWARNGVIIPGATNTALHIAAAGSTNAGNYAVRVSNGEAVAASQVAILTVLGATGGTDGGGGTITNPPPIVITNLPPPVLVTHLPVITEQPASGSLFGGESITLSVTATNALAYQWKFNGSNLAGETNSTLTVSNFSSANVGTYTVAVSNGDGVVTSGRADWALAAHVSGQLLDINFTAHLNPAFSGKSGAAAIGINNYDIWNVYSRDVLDMFDWRASGTVTNLSWANGTSSGVTLTVTNAPGAWLTLCGDPMMKSYLYPFVRRVDSVPLVPGGFPNPYGSNYVQDANIYATLSGLPAQQYDIYVYAHGQPNEENAIVELKVGGTSVATKTNSFVAGWDNAQWVEGNQFVRFARVNVPVGADVQIVSHPGISGLAVINGIQLAAQDAAPVAFAAAAYTGVPEATVAARIPGPAQFTGGVTFAGNVPQLTLQGELGAKYLIEVSSDLTNWTALGIVENLNGSVTVSDAQTGGATTRFYRATLQ